MTEREQPNAYERGFEDAKAIYHEPWWMGPLWLVALAAVLMFSVRGCSARIHYETAPADSVRVR